VEPQHTPGRDRASFNPPWSISSPISNSGAAYCDFYVNEQGTFLPYDQSRTAPIWTRPVDYCIHPTPEGYSTTYFSSKAQAFHPERRRDRRPTVVPVPRGACAHARARHRYVYAEFIPDKATRAICPREQIRRRFYQENDPSDKPPYLRTAT